MLSTLISWLQNVESFVTPTHIEKVYCLAYSHLRCQQLLDHGLVSRHNTASPISQIFQYVGGKGREEAWFLHPSKAWNEAYQCEVPIVNALFVFYYIFQYLSRERPFFFVFCKVLYTGGWWDGGQINKCLLFLRMEKLLHNK